MLQKIVLGNSLEPEVIQSWAIAYYSRQLLSSSLNKRWRNTLRTEVER